MNLPIVQIVLRPGITDLGWGHPDPTLLPVQMMRQATATALDRFGADALAYGIDQGAGPLLAWLIERIGQAEGRVPAIDEIMITGGASHALDQICTLCTQPGDAILVESPTYHLAVRILRDHPLDLVPVPVDADGLRIDALAEAIANLRRAGRTPRFLYTIPTFHNPTGASLSMERRRALVDLAATEDFLIVEDDVYRDLAYDGPAPPSLWSMAPAGVVARMGSFAKSLAPGLRLGWLTGGAAMVQRIVGGGLLDSGGALNHFTAVIVATLCMDGLFDQQVNHLRTVYRARRDALVGALRASLPAGSSVMVPGGGFFTWVRLPEGFDAVQLLPRAEAVGVAYLPGSRFHLDGGGTNTLRVAFSLYPPEILEDAGNRLGQALRK